MGDGTAGLCSHLPCVADIAHTAGCHAEFNKEYSMKSKRALDISALPPIENLKSVLSATGALNRCSNMGRLSIKGIICVISWRGRAVFNTAAIIILYQRDRAS